MKLLAVAIVAVCLALFTIAYCFSGRRVRSRPGVFYILISALACEALLVSYLLVETGQWVRSSIITSIAKPGSLASPTGGDPGGVGLVSEQSVRVTKPKKAVPGEWLIWQAQLRDFLRVDLYELDNSSEVDEGTSVKLTQETEDGDLLRREYEISAIDGDPITAVLLVPRDRSKPLPGILMIPGHVPDGGSGLAEMVLDVESYHGSAARELAKAGFVTLTIELRGFGTRGPPEHPDHRIVAYNSLVAGDFFKKWVFRDIQKATDFLISLPDTDSQRIGMAGVSLGGEIAVEYAALDERVRVVSFHSHGGRVGPFPAISRTPKKYPHLCHLIPGANEIMERQDPFLLIAPRPLQGVRGGSQPFAENEFKTELQSLWTKLAAEDALELIDVRAPQPHNGHIFYVAQSIDFFKKHL